jgi:hypothetical protein
MEVEVIKKCIHFDNTEFFDGFIRVRNLHYTTLALTDEHRLRVFENRVLRGIFGPKREEVTGGWRRLHNEELHDLCASPNIIRGIRSKRMRLMGYVTRIGEMRNAYSILVGKPDRKTPLGRPKRRWEDTI